MNNLRSVVIEIFKINYSMKNRVAPYLSGLFGLSVIIYRYLRKILQTGSGCLYIHVLVSATTSEAVGHGFSSQSGYTKHHHKDGTNFSPAWHTDIMV